MLRLAQHKEGEGAGAAYLAGGCARRRQRAGPPLAQSPPPGKEDLEQGRREFFLSLSETRETFKKQRERGREAGLKKPVGAGSGFGRYPTNPNSKFKFKFKK